jgi:phospholipid/cholesterol/gamma-HCH transport system substrate-binding protein
VNLRREARWIGVIAAIMVVALGCAAYILSHERVRSPLDHAYVMRAAFTNVSAVLPSAGEPVTIAGVQVGQIAAVRLVEGHGVLDLRMQEHQVPRLHAGTRAALIPNTPAKDLQVDLVPGDPAGPSLPRGATIPLALTTTPVDSDELLRTLDADNRQWLRTLITDLGTGLDGRGRDLRSLLRSLGPTSAQLERIGALLASRRHALPRLVHNLGVLTAAAGQEGDALTTVVRSGHATVSALAGQDRALGRSLTLLPGTLATLHGTLAHTGPFARSLRRTLVALNPTLDRLPSTVAQAPDALRGLLPLPLAPLRRFTTAAGPLTGPVRSASRDIGAAIAPLTTAFKVLEQTTNAMNHQAADGTRSYLFWFAWFAHNANSMVSTEDAHGAAWRGIGLLSCDSLAQPGALGQVMHLILGSSSGCP